MDKVLFKDYVECAVQCKELTDEYITKICGLLTIDSPRDNEWYYHNGFFRVDVVKADYEAYMDFIENLTGCSYCHTLNDTGLTFMVSLTTLNNKL